MSWEQRTFAVSHQVPNLTAIDALLSTQRGLWAAYDQAVSDLDGMTVREYATADAPILAKLNPRRSASIHAKTDAASIARRPCFLCEENLPPAEQGIAWGGCMVFPNPFPIHPRHLTIVQREHQPQAIHGRLIEMLALAQGFGPAMLVFYNGPRCGASAPDHFHLQACERTGIPLVAQLDACNGGEGVLPMTLTGRRFLLYTADRAERLASQLQRSIAAMKKPGETEEAMFNLIVWRADPCLKAILFPRAAHRPACFYAEGNARIAVSPAALEMAGLLMVSDPSVLNRLRPDVIEAIYREVSYRENDFARLTEAIL